MVNPGLSLDQLRIFLLTVDAGSFSEVARRLGRAQSVVTYAVQELEADTGLRLFDRSGYRPRPTPEALALLPRARRLVADAAALQAQAESIGRGLEPELTLVVDAMFPMASLTGSLSGFQTEFPSVRTHVHVETLGGAAEMIVEGHADLGLVAALITPFEGLQVRRSLSIELVPVCAPTHPLAAIQAQSEERLPPEVVGDHLQLVLADRSLRTQGRDYGVETARTWRLADLGAKHSMLRAGLGWGSLPRPTAEDDLAAGRLLELRLARWGGADHLPKVGFVLVRRQDRPQGPAGRWLFERLSRLDETADT